MLLGQNGTFGVGYETDFTTFDGSNESASFVPGVSPLATAGTFALTDLSSFNYPSNLSTSGEAFGWTSISTAVLQRNFVRLNTMALGTNDGLISSHWANRRLVVEMDLTMNADAGDAVFPLLHVKLTFEDDSTQECVYLMGSNVMAINQLGMYTQFFDGNSGGIPLGFDIPLTVEADLGTLNSLNHPPADNYENHSSALATGFMLDHSNGTSNYIKHLETAIFFGAVTASSTIVVKEVRTRIIQQ